MSFEDLGLAPAILSSLRKAGFTEPTSVQAAAIPMALAGQDLMVSAQTGSGKTAAFMLPALNRMAGRTGNGGKGVQVLVLTPTRELAQQVHDATRTYGDGLEGLRTTTVVGGMPYGAQLRALSRRVDVLVATPGRLIDHIEARRVDLSTVHTLVLDEADRMLDMGFIEDIENIVARTPADRQTLLFSATLDGTIAKLAERMMRDPQRVEISGHRQQHTNITQSLLYADDAAHKHRLLDHLLRDASLNQAIVFTSTKRGADELADRLIDEGFPAASLHGDMNQRQRTRTLAQMQRGHVRVLVATDVAARGIDVQGISHAVNFDLPLQAEDYVHRIGRTGRAGRDGMAITLAVHGERHKVRRIEHYIGRDIPCDVIAGLEPQRTPRPRTGGPRPGQGRPGGRPYGKPFNRSEGGYQGKPRFPREDGQRPYARRDDRDGEARPHARREAGAFDKPRFERRDEGGFQGKPRFERREEGAAYGKPRFERREDGPSYGKPRFERREEGAAYGKPRFERREDGPSYGKPRFERRDDNAAPGKPRFERREDGASYGKPRFERSEGSGFGKSRSGFGDGKKRFATATRRG